MTKLDQSNQSPVSIVIPTFNRPDKLENLLRSIAGSTVKDCEVIIVDDCSAVPTEDSLQSYLPSLNLRVKVIRNKTNQQLTKSRNIGMKAASGKYIFLVDDDNILDPKCIEVLRDKLASDEHIGVVGPVTYFANNPKTIWWAGTSRNMTTSRTHFIGTSLPLPDEPSWPSDDFPNAWMITREIVDRGCFLDERYKIHYDEADYCARIKKLGYKLFVVRDARSNHDFEPDSPSALAERWLDHRRVYYSARNRVVFHKEYSTSREFLQFALFWNWLFTAYYMQYILRIPTKNWSTKLKSCFSYLKGSIDGFYGFREGI